MKKNDIFTVTITDLSNDGSGIARHDGQVVFIPFTAVGDVVEARAVKVTKSLIYGKLERIITASPDRISNDCNVFASGSSQCGRPVRGMPPVVHRCGGCDFRHISYEAELCAKETFIKSAFTRIGKLSPPPEFLPIIPSPQIARYRNKAQYPVSRDGYRVISGFYAARSHRIVPHDDCKLQPEIFNEIKEFVLSFTGELRHICMREAYSTGEINVMLVSQSKNKKFYELAEAIMKKFPKVNGVVLNIKKDENNVILGDEEHLLAGESDITDEMSGVKLKISPRSFYQVNTPAAELLYGVIREFVQPAGKTILDLYCGIGSIGLSMADKAEKVFGVERVESAVKNATANACLNGFTNAEFICGDAGSMPDIQPDAIILDPARKGCETAVLENAAKLSPEKIIMVSCDPASAARDCGRLNQLGYRAVRVQGVDLFPRTRHVECVT